MGVIDDLLKKTKEAARKNAKTRAAGKKKKKKASVNKKQEEQKRSFTQTRNIDRVRGSRKTTSAPSSKPEEEKKREASTAAWDKFGRNPEGSGLRESMRPVEEEKRNVDPVALQGNTGRTREELERIDTQRELAPYDDYDWLKANLQAVESRNKNKGVGPMAVPDPELDTQFDFREASGRQKMSETADTLIQNWDKVSAENRVDTANYILQAYGFNDQTRGIIMDTFKNASDSDKLKMLETAVYITGQSDDVKAMQDMVNNSPTIASAEVDHSSEAQSERAMRTLNRSMVNDYRTYQEQQKYIDRFVEDGRYSRGDALKFKAAYHISNIGQNRLNAFIMDFSDWLRQGQDGYDVGFTDNKMQRWSESENIFDLAATVGGDVLHDLFSVVGLPVSMLSKLFLDESDLQDLTDFAMGLNQGYMDSVALENRIYESANLSAVDRFALDTMGVVIEMIPTILMSITGAPTLGMTDFATSAAGASARQAYEQGATLEESVKYGLSIGTAEAMIEKMFTGFGYMGKGVIAPFVRKLIPEKKILTGATRRILQESGFMDSVSYRIMKGVIASGGEATEEMVMEVVTPYIERATYNPEAMNATISEIGYAGGLGAMAAAVMGLPVTITDVASAKDKSRAYDQIVDDYRQRLMGQLNEAVASGEMTAEEAKAVQAETDDVLSGKGSLNVSSAVPEEKVAGEALDTVYDTYEEAKKAMMQEARTKKDGEKITANYIDNGVVRTFTTTAKGGTLGLGRSTEAGKEYQRIAQAKNVTERSGYQLNVKEEIIKEVSSLSKAIGREVEFYRNDDATDHGYMDKKTGKIYINAGSSQSAARSVIAHELTHQMESTAGWSKLVELMKKHYGSSYESRRQERIDAYEAFGKPLKVDETRKTYDEADQELVAMFVEEKLLTDADTIREVVNTDKTLAQKIIAWINKVIQKLAGSKEQKMLVEARDLWNQALTEEQSGKLKPRTIEEEVTDDAAETLRLSIGINGELAEKATKVNAEDGMVPAKMLKTALKNRDQLIKTYETKLIPDIKSNTEPAIKQNQSYGVSYEPTTICSRSLALEGLVELIAKKYKRPLTSAEQIIIAQESMLYAGDKAECLFCYQANAKRAYENALNKYLADRRDVIRRYNEGMDDETNYRIMMDFNFKTGKFRTGRKDTDSSQARFNTFIEIAKGNLEPVPVDLLINTRTLDESYERTDLPEDYKIQFDQIKEYARGASRAKGRTFYSTYRGEILDFAKKTIEKLNSAFGLRMFSFSEFSPAFMLEYMQVITDASIMGLKMLAYTKEPAFVEVFHGTNIAINVSLAGVENPEGGYDCDGMQSMDWNTAKDLRSKYDNVGTVYVAKSDKEVKWALAQDWIDTVIPFHISGGSAAMSKDLGWKNYTSVQSEKSKIQGVKPRAIYPPEFQNDEQTYLDLCEKYNVYPKFNAMRKDKSYKNYMKLVNETRQKPADIKPVQPVFDMEAMDRVMKEFSGEYDAPLGGSRKVLEFAADEISEKVKERRAQMSFFEKNANRKKPATLKELAAEELRFADLDIRRSIGKSEDAEYIAAVNRGDMTTAQRMVDEAAKAAGYGVEAYHGTKADFTVFDKERVGVNYNNWSMFGGGFYFALSKRLAEDWGRGSKYGENVKVMPVYLKMENPLKANKPIKDKQAEDIIKQLAPNADEDFIRWTLDRASRFAEYLSSEGYAPLEIQEVFKKMGYDSIDDSMHGKFSQYVVFNANQIKSADPVTYDEEGNIIPLSERFNEESDDIRWSVGEKDAEYMDAVESGDMGTALRLVREAANIAGFTSPKLHHGTKSFGFTQLRTKDLDIFEWSPFFATPDPNLAETYSGETERRQLRGGYPKATQDQIDEHLAEYYGVLKKRIRAIDKHLSKPALPRANDAKRRSLMKDARNELANIVEAQDAKTFSEAYNRYIDAVDALEKTAMLPAEEALFEFDEVHKARWNIDRIISAEEVFITPKGKLVTYENREEIESDTAGIYSFYANLDGMLEIDGEGRSWNHIDGSKIGKEGYAKTRDVALYAKENGYTGVIIRNIYDSGGQTDYYEPGDIYIFFEPASQVKSADPVTYDDNGEVIPLEERFNPKNNDIRWSVGSYKSKYKKGDKFHWLGEAVTVDKVVKEKGVTDTYILRYEDGSTDAVKGDELMSDEDVEKYNAKKGNAVFGEDVVEYRVGERVTLGFGEKGYIKDKYRMSGSEYAYTVDLDNGDTMTHITADDIVNHMRDIKHINDGYVPPARKSKAQIEISKNYLVGDTVSYLNERASIVERNNPKGGTLTYTLELDNGDRVEVTADQLQVGVTPELHFDELPKEEQEAWHEPPEDWDMSRQIEDVYAEPITVSEFLELLYENGITVSKRTMNTWFRDHGFYEKRKKKNEKDRISEKGQKSGMFKKEGKDIMITEEGQKYFLQTFLHADKETVDDMLEEGKIKLPSVKTYKESPLDEEAYADMTNEYEDEIFDTGIDYWWATLLTGKGVTYSKDYARNFDAAAQNNPEARKYLQKYFVRPLETAKADYASNVRDKLESIKAKMAELGIQMDTEKASAVQWIGEGQYQDKYGDLHEYTLENLKEEFPNDWENIKKAEEFFREMYDQYLKDINQAREKIYPHPLEDAQDKMAAYEARRDRAAERIADQRAIIADIEKVLVAKKAEILKKKRTDTKVYANLQNSIRYNEERLARAKEHLNDYIDRKNKYDVLANEIKAAIDSGDILRNKRIIPRKDYFHHFQELSVGLGDVFSMSNNTSEIDPRLEGTSGYTEPRSKFSGVTLHRKHGRYKADAIEGMVRYVQTGEYMIHIDPVISEFRNHIVGMAKVTKDSRNANKLIRWLVQWTNDLAGKTNPADRWAQDFIGRETIKRIKKINSIVKANAVVGNFSSATAQFFNFPNLQAYVNDPKAYTAGFRDLLRFIRRDKDTRLLMRQSGFLNERYLDDAINALETKTKDKISHAAQWTLVVGDRYTSAMVWFTAYNAAVNKGKKRPIEYADDITRRCVAGRGIGEIPLAQKALVTQVFAPFQIEVNNAYQLYKEKIVGAATGRTEKDKLVSAGQFGLILVMNFLMNSVTELINHQRVVYDPIYVFLQCLSDWKNGDDDEEEKNIAEKFAELLGRQAGEIISNIPYGSLLAYYGINWSWARENIFGDQDPTRFGVSNIALDWAAGFVESLFTGKDIVDDVLSFGTTFLMPFGGKQTERTLQGLVDSGILPELKIGWKEGISFGWKKAPGSYDKNGQLQFPLKSPISYDEDGKLQFGFDSVGDLGEWLTLLAFGKYATDEGQKYLGKDYEASTLLQNIFGFNKTKERTTLSERATEVVVTLAKNGSDVFEVYDTVRELQDAENIFEKRNILAEADLTDAEKAKILLGYVVREEDYDSTLEKMNGVISVGLGVDDYLKIANLYSLVNDSEEYQTATEKTLLFDTELAAMGYTSEQIKGVNEVMAYFSHIPADTSKFDELIGLGLSTETTLAIQKTLGELEPLEGETQVSSLQKAEAIAGMGLSKDEETAAMAIALDDNTYVKYKVVTDYGVDAQTWVDLQNALDYANANNPDESKRNKSFDKEEKKAALDSLNVSNETRAALWQILDNQLYSSDPNHDTAWKAGRNPYSSSVGAQVVDACVEGKSALAASKETDETESAYTSPVSGDIVINSEYGYRIHPISGQWKMHDGLDIDGEQGDPVFAAAEGTVVKAVHSDTGYGNHVIIEHADGTQTLYAHMYSYGVEVGQTVSQGEQIGEVGSTGGTTGPHLHFEVRVDGQDVNPQTIFDFTGEGIIAESDPNYTPIVSGGGSSGGGSSGGSSRSGSTASVGSRTSQVASNRRSGGLTLPSVGGSGGNGGGSRASTPVAGMSTSAPTFGARGLYLPKASDYTPNRRSISSSVATTQRTGRTGGSFWDDNILS